MAIVQEGPPTFLPPGAFHALINGPADITVFHGMSFICRMSKELIIESQNDCLWQGFVSDLVDEWLKTIWTDVLNSVGSRAVTGWRNRWRFEAKNLWTATLSRILISIQRQRHGGAILFSSDYRRDLSIKYALEYPRVAELMRESLRNQILFENIHDKIEWRIVNGQRSTPNHLHNKLEVLEANLKDADQALTGAVRFISSMAGVDGLVLVSPEFIVRGFGVEITTKQDISELTAVSSPDQSRGRKVRADHYGTRHRSMFRYCSENPGALGFVVSQDGDIRVITNTDGHVVLFENIKIHSLFEDDLQKMIPALSPKKEITRYGTMPGGVR